MFELLHYQKKDGPDLFGLWLEGLKDRRAKARITARLLRLHNGNFGDCKPVGEGVWEQRIDWGPGYRVYYAIQNKRVVLLCDGGLQAHPRCRHHQSHWPMERMAVVINFIQLWNQIY